MRKGKLPMSMEAILKMRPLKAPGASSGLATAQKTIWTVLHCTPNSHSHLCEVFLSARLLGTHDLIQSQKQPYK